MKNGDARSPAWIARKLKTLQRDDEATQSILCLVDIAPIPSLDEIRTWTDTECLLAVDWAGAVHLSASDNNNRVPCVPPHLVAYRPAFPLRNAEQVAEALVQEMAGDNGCHFDPTDEQMAKLRQGVEKMQRYATIAGACSFTDAEIILFSSGEETERQEHFGKFEGFKDADAALCVIFDDAVRPV